MPITKSEKQELLAQLTDQAGRAKSIVFGYYRGLKVKEVEELRRKCRAEQIDYVVAKKTLVNLALQKAGVQGFDAASFDKPLAVAFSYDDEVAPARLLNGFTKGHEAFQIVGGVLEHKFVDASQVVALSSLPSKEELLAKVVGSLNAPASGFVNVLAGNLRQFVYALNAIKDAKSV